jgi:hypothetical protein
MKWSKLLGDVVDLQTNLKKEFKFKRENKKIFVKNLFCLGFFSFGFFE